MDRRSAIGAAAALVAATPLVARAQAAKVARVGFLGNSNASSGATQVNAFRRGLSDLGWVEGKNLVIEYRWSEGRSDHLPALLADLVRTGVDVIMVSGPLAIAAAQKATDTIPIVFVLLVDPIPLGFVRISRTRAAT
jgi:putative ABC transport system substrate-binding protein